MNEEQAVQALNDAIEVATRNSEGWQEYDTANARQWFGMLMRLFRIRALVTTGTARFPRTELGAKLVGLREQAIAGGMELLSEDEIGREHD
jgi:hypothetical protein